MGLIRCTTDVSKAAIKQLKSHLTREKAAIKGDDVGLRSFCWATSMCAWPNAWATACWPTPCATSPRAPPIAMLYQSSHDAAQSCEEHVLIVQALEKGDLAKAEKLMQAHIGSVQAALKLQAGGGDPLAQLRSALSPLDAQAPADKPASSPRFPCSQARPCLGQNHRRFLNLPEPCYEVQQTRFFPSPSPQPPCWPPPAPMRRPRWTTS